MSNKTSGIYFRISDSGEAGLEAVHHLAFEEGSYFTVGEYARAVRESLPGIVRELKPITSEHSDEVNSSSYPGKYQDELGLRVVDFDIPTIRFRVIKRSLEQAITSPSDENLKLFGIAIGELINSLSIKFTALNQ